MTAQRNVTPGYEFGLDGFPFGVQYYRAPTPLPTEWDDDLRRIAAIGYTHVQYRPQWRWHERVRDRYTFDDLDRLFDLAAQHGLRVVLKPMLETAPDWVFEDLRGTRVGFHGIPISAMAIGSFYVGGWLPCFDNPAVLHAANDFVGQLVRRYQNRQALWFYDAWNEPRSKPLGQCHCVHSVQSYQHWLTARFASVDQLNEAYGKAWSSMASVRPPASAGDYAEMLLWRQWAAHAVAGHVQAVVQTIRSHDPDRKILVHAGYCSVLQDPACDANDDLLTAATADRYGTSFPLTLRPTQPAHHAEADLISDWLRRVDPDYWCHEFYPNQTAWCRPPQPQTLSRLIWMALAGGAAGMTFWQYRSERLGDESNGWGMREINGDPTPRSDACDTIAAVLREHGAKLAASRRAPAQIALLYSRESDLLGRVERMAFDEPDPRQARIRTDYPCKLSLHSAHFLYQALGHVTDFVVPGDELEKYSVVHLTAIEMIDDALAQRLRRYVRGGGRVIVEYPFACRDARTWVSPDRPSHGLHDLTGCREAQRIALDDDAKSVRFDHGITVNARVWHIELTPDGGTPFAWWPDGSVAAVRHGSGKGDVVTLGMNLSLSLQASWDDPAMSVVDHILRGWDIEPAHAADRGIWVRRRECKDSAIWFVFNVSDALGSMTLPCEQATIWHQTGTQLQGRFLTLEAGAVWVAEMGIARRTAQAKSVRAKRAGEHREV